MEGSEPRAFSRAFRLLKNLRLGVRTETVERVAVQADFFDAL